MTWHAQTKMLESYAGGRAEEAAAASLEAHLINCARCRAALAAAAAPPGLDRVWRSVEAEIAAPSPGRLERLLLRVGIAEHTARLLAATPALRLSWVAASAAALTFGAMAARFGSRQLVVFLAAAPLLPLAGVALSYGPRGDRAYELAMAAPLPGLKLLLLRAAAVLSSATLVGATAATALPGLELLHAAWLLPALALTLTSLALSSTMPLTRAAGVVGAIWVAASVWAIRPAGGRPTLVMFGPEAQILFAIMAAASLAAISRQRSRYETGEWK